MIYIALLFVVCFYLHIATRGEQRLVICKKKSYKRASGFFVSFLILAFFSAIRDDCGCDYNSYILHIERIQMGKLTYMEPGFQWVVLFLERYDTNPRFVIIVFAVLTVFFYLLAIWRQSTNKFMSVYIFLTWGYYFITFNTIRNYFALAVVLCTLPLIIKRKYIWFIIIVLLSATIHKSAVVCIPIYYLANKITLTKKHILPICLFIILLISLQPLLRSYAFIFYESYEDSVYDTGRISILNVLKALAVIGVYVKFRKYLKDDELSKLYFNLNVGALILYWGVFWLPAISRIGFYMNATVMLFFPRVIESIPSLGKRKEFKIMLYVASFVLFLLLLNQFAAETNRVLPYKTWLFGRGYDHYGF